jgi:hypothetical protein
VVIVGYARFVGSVSTDELISHLRAEGMLAPPSGTQKAFNLKLVVVDEETVS